MRKEVENRYHCALLLLAGCKLMGAPLVATQHFVALNHNTPSLLPLPFLQKYTPELRLRQACT